MISQGAATVGTGDFSLAAISKETSGDIEVPSVLGGCPVVEIGQWAFSGCSKLTGLTVPLGVTSIGGEAFFGCSSLLSVALPASVKSFGGGAFGRCNALGSVTIPDCDFSSVFRGCDAIISVTIADGVTSIGACAFIGCHNLTCVAIPPSVIDIGENAFCDSVAVPASWADNYPTFTTKFGADFTKALSMKTGKKDGAGNDMFVWQDYVVGTDPTKEDDVFKASITIVDGKVTIFYSPELDEARKALRKYTTWGKTSLLDKDWTVVQEGHESEYDFFKVSVEMK